MRRTNPTLWMITASAAMSCMILLAWFLLGPDGARAQAPVPPPPPETPTQPPEPTDTPAPTDTASPTDTALPTDTPAPTKTSAPTNSPSPTKGPAPTHTTAPTAKPTSVQPPPSPTTAEKTAPGSEPSPDCQSAVEGSVLGVSGEPVGGATVKIDGTGWSDGIMTDENGRYGFGGLCAGTAQLGAYLADGQASQTAQVELNGRDRLQLDLHVAAAETATIISAPLAQQSPTPEPDMPATGHSGWLVVGAAFLGALLLVSAGARRLLGAGERAKDRD